MQGGFQRFPGTDVSTKPIYGIFPVIRSVISIPDER